MFERRSLKLPITLGVAMILVIVALIVGWVLLTIYGAVQFQSQLYWVLLTVGSLMFALVLVGVIIYLTLTIKAINLTRRQSNFIDSVTHELKSPIASLKLYLQTLDIRSVSEEEREKFHRFMMDDVERLDALISHLLDAGNIEKNRHDQEYDEIQLDELIQGCATTVCGRYRVDTSTVETDLKPCVIRAPRVDTVMIFRNLIDNAVKYAGVPPRVYVSLRIEGDWAIAEISDNGDGIPKNLRNKVFGRFVRLGAELQRKKPGTGLGLYIVRTLVKRMGGKVSVLDRDKKLGTLFEVRLPGATSELGTGSGLQSEPDAEQEENLDSPDPQIHTANLD